MKPVPKVVIMVTLTPAVMAGWFLFVASLSRNEIVLAILFTILAVPLIALAWEEMEITFSPTLKQVLALWRLPWYILSGTWEMFTVLAKELFGKRAGSYFRFTPFHPADPCEAQIVLATAYTTVAPNFIVIGVSHDILLFHQVERSGVPRMITDLESGS